MVVAEMAKLTPAARPWALTPTTRPRASISGPPELPGLMAASVWIASGTEKPVSPSITRPTAGHDARRGAALQPVRRPDRQHRVPDADRALGRELERSILRRGGCDRSAAPRGRSRGRCRRCAAGMRSDERPKRTVADLARSTTCALVTM